MPLLCEDLLRAPDLFVPLPLPLPRPLFRAFGLLVVACTDLLEVRDCELDFPERADFHEALDLWNLVSDLDWTLFSCWRPCWSSCSKPEN